MNHKMAAAAVAARLADLQAGFAASGKPGDFLGNAVRVIGERLRQHPERYVEYGPYWWAVKQVLNEGGAALGERGDPLVAAEYRGASPAETLVAGEVFKDFYRATFIVGTSTFDLAGDGELYELGDEDMQARAAA